MKTSLISLSFTILCMLGFETSLAQCPGTLTLTVSSVSAADCPDNGIVTLGGNAVGNAAVVFSIISGPSRVGVQQSSAVFNSLAAGTYIFRATCNAQTADVTVTVNNNYVPLDPGFNVVVNNICTNYSTGGTITITGISGGKAPLQYSFIQNGSANYNDALSNYGASTSFTTSSWGVYQVRVKDACGVFLTKTINLQPTYPAAHFGGASVDFNNVACDSAGLYFWMNDDNYQGVSLSDYPRLRFRVYEKAGNCIPGALIKSFELTASGNEYFVIPRRDVVVEVTTPCGEVRTECYDYPDVDTLQTYWKPLLKGCGGGSDPFTISIKHQYNYYAKEPLTVRLFNNNTNNLLQTINNAGNWGCCSFDNLPLDDYRIEVTDACGNTTQAIVTPPTGTVGFLPTDLGTYVDKECTYQDGKTTVKLAITGLISNLDISTLTIGSGPDNIGQSATMNSTNGLFYFFSLTPGATYGFTLNNGCISVPLSFTVPTDNWRIVEFEINPSVTQQCGGSGTIAANINYSGWGAYRSELWQGGTKIAENNSGIFTNIPPGLYTVKGIAVQSWCTNSTSSELSDTVRVYNDATPPQLLRQFGFICETAGIPGSTGSATVEVGGFGPFKYDLKRISPNPQSAYTTAAVNAAGNYTFNSLDAYAVYSLLITDNCGKSTVSELVVGNIGNLSFVNPYEPCVNSPYLLSAMDIPGASYSWQKIGSPVILSTTKDLYFVNYSSGYDGDYTCTITLAGGCLQRVLNAKLNSNFCGALLPVKISSLYARTSDCNVHVSWKTMEAGNGIFEVQRSNDGQNYSTIGTIGFDNNGPALFNFVDENPPAGNNFYRLKLIDRLGKFGFSKQLSVKNSCGMLNPDFSIYPNPVTTNYTTVYINSDKAQNIEIHLLNVNGQSLKRLKTLFPIGKHSQQLDLSNLPRGLYIVNVKVEGELKKQFKVLRR